MNKFYSDILITLRPLSLALMNSLEDSAKIFRYHRDLINFHGADSTYALGWRDEHDQLVRFEALSQIADLNGRSVLDAGCGYADLYPYLKRRFPDMEHYCGVEQIPELIDEATRRYAHLPDVSFLPNSFLRGDLPVKDYVFASGSLNYGSTRPEFIFDAISRLYNASNLGLAFNLLKYMPADGTLVAYEPLDILTYCQSLGNNVVYKDDYAPEDFTIFLYR